MAPSHYLNEYWFLIDVVMCHLPQSDFSVSAQATILYNKFENYIFKNTSTSPRGQWVNHWRVKMKSQSLLGNSIWRHTSGLTLAQVMAWCLTAPSHYLNQCWLTIKDILWHSPKSYLTRSAHELNLQPMFKDHHIKITITSPRSQRVMVKSQSVPGNSIWWHISGSTLIHVMACCLWHQAITWTNVDLPSKTFCGIHLRAIWQEVLMNLIRNPCSKITISRLLSHLLGTNELWWSPKVSLAAAYGDIHLGQH